MKKEKKGGVENFTAIEIVSLIGGWWKRPGSQQVITIGISHWCHHCLHSSVLVKCSSRMFAYSKYLFDDML